MENNYKNFGSIKPFPKLKPPLLPQANPPALTSRDFDNQLKDIISILSRAQYDFYEGWLIPELKSNRICTIRLDSFDWSVFQERLLKIDDEIEKIDIYFLTHQGIFGVASEGLFALNFTYCSQDNYGHYGSPGLMRQVIENSQNRMIELLIYSGIFDFLLTIHLFDFWIEQKKIRPLINQSKWVFEKLGIGYIAYLMPTPSDDQQELQILNESEPKELKNLLNYATDEVREHIRRRKVFRGTEKFFSRRSKVFCGDFRLRSIS
ncbi:MAG: hypothetical protein ACTSQI_22135 [Candidatus Helarchaeota archaeon]